MKYVVVSAVVTDEIHLANGMRKIVPGGAGFYALCGIKLWTDDVGVVTGIGKDYMNIHGMWYRKNNISMKGMKIKSEKSPYTVIRYFSDGERTESPSYGEAHFKKLETDGEELASYFESAKGIYIFKNLDDDFWENILRFNERYSGKVLWELAADAALPENVKRVKEIATHLNAFSLNMTEAGKLFDTMDEAEIIKQLSSWKMELIFLRCGARGAFMISSEDIQMIPSQPNVNVVDPTGGGNSSTGAVLYGLAEGYSPEVCGRMGSISAAMCISQYGGPEIITREMRTESFGKAGVKEAYVK